jgi:C1A family cysteine protease
VPSKLLEIAKQHKIKTVSLVKTYEECRDALANGFAVTIASNQGFSNTRDNEGFAQPEGEWPHQMCLLGVDDAGQDCSKNRPGVLVVNSWGKWNSGPKRLGQPDGSFWVDAEVIEERVLSDGDSWAYSDYDGFPKKEINLEIV